MERNVRLRAATRSAFTRTLNRLKEEMGAAEMDRDSIAVSMAVLEKKAAELAKFDEQILELAVEEEGTDLEEESATADEYQRKYLEMKVRASKVLTTSGNESENGTSVNGAGNQRKFKLPKLEFRKFGGDVKEWLQFWTQFEKVDKDDDIVPEDKFQYLLQATVEGSRAREVVESFPPTGANYVKAIQSLKSRFGREDILVEVYVRELLKLVLQNALQGKTRSSLLTLYDRIESQLRALETLGVTTDKCAAMLYPLVESCMPEDLLRAWQRSADVGEVNDPQQRLEKLIKFLRSEVENEERISLAMAGFGLKAEKSSCRKRQELFPPTEDVPTAMGLLTFDTSKKNPRCIFCTGQHISAECFAAQKMSLAEKNTLLKEKGCCFGCLKTGHGFRRCKASLRCALCGKRHVILMCPRLPQHQGDCDKGVETGKEAERSVPVEHSLTTTHNYSRVMLQTLMVFARGENRQRKVRALIDTGSQKSYILKPTAVELGLQPKSKVAISHSLFGGVTTEPQQHQSYLIRLGSIDGHYKCNFEVLDQATICGNIPGLGEGPWSGELRQMGITLSDINEGPTTIELLIGADVAGRLLTGQKRELSSGLVAIETHLGWTLMGKAQNLSSTENDLAITVTSMFINESSIENLWRLDVIGIEEPSERKTKGEHEAAVRERFRETLTTNNEGRYEVRLPWTEEHPPLPTNRNLAERRLRTMSRRLRETGQVETYDGIIRDWLRTGVVEEVPIPQVGDYGHYLPHRPLIKESSSTTPVRPIFDASAKEQGFPSLNQCLEKGPNLLELIPSLLLRFRHKRIGVIADIEKAFLQISVHPQDRDFLRFLWWENVDTTEIKVLRHTRVTFGVTSSPFLLGAVIESHLDKALEHSPDNVQQLRQLKDSFYVDNVVTSVNDMQELKFFRAVATKVMTEGGFNLRGWEHSQGSVNDHSHKLTMVLGVCWNKKHDTLLVKIPDMKVEDVTKISKRVILSVAHQIYDPIGTLCPVLLCPRLLMQRAWGSGINWDTEVNEDLKKEFLQWCQEVILLKDLETPRWIHAFSGEAETLQLHVFCDASQKAYATAIFVRVETETEVKVSLVAAKARVAPLKNMTIPRMELLAALIGARLFSSVCASLKCEDAYFWTDSSTVLTWIQKESCWSVFVGNRVNEIRRLTKPASWRYVPGTQNPADLPSRGCSAGRLIESRWWEGPPWLRESPDVWPGVEMTLDEEEINSEKRKTSRSFMGHHSQSEILMNIEESPELRGSKDIAWLTRRFSNYGSIIRLVGWIRRFLRNCRLAKGSRATGELCAEEIDRAEKTVLQLVQEEEFGHDGSKRLQPLKVYKDEDGILRAQTRIIYRTDTEDFCKPIVLPSRHPVVQRLIMTEHRRHCHAGVQVLLGILRERYWILKGRRAIRSVLTGCVHCRRFEAAALEVPCPPLPKDRIKDAAVFETTGVDYARPVFLRGGQKAWICLFYLCGVSSRPFRTRHIALDRGLHTSLAKICGTKGSPFDHIQRQWY